MADKITNLLREGKIDRFHYDTYMLFEDNDRGRDYLKNMLESIVLEESDPNKGFAWQDGRRSCWREIRTMINLVKNIAEGVEKNERNNGSNNQQYREFDFGSSSV